MRLRMGSRKPGRNWLARGEQYRLLALVALAGGLMLVLGRVRDANNWRWFTQMGRQPERAQVTAAEASAVGVKPAEGAPELTVDLGQVVDFTEFSAVEYKSLHALSDQLAARTAEQLEAASRGHASYRQLFHQPRHYRGQVVTVAGMVRAAERMPAEPAAGATARPWFRLWLTPTATRQPIVLHVLEPPAGFPLGTELREEVEATGVFFKVWSYPTDTATGTEPRLAPLLVARGVRWKESRVPRERLAAATLGAAGEPHAGAEAMAKYPAARDYLRLAWDLTDDDWSGLHDDEPTFGPDVAADADERATAAGRLVGRLLTNGPKLPPRLARGWLRDEAPLDQLAASPPLHRGRPVRLEGRIAAVQPLAVRKDWAGRLEFSQYYRCQLEGPAGATLVVFTRQIPPSWLTPANLGQRASCTGVFLQRESRAGQPARLSFVAERVAGHRPGLLGDLGLDAGVLERIKPVGPMQADDHAAVLEILAAASPLSAAEVDRHARRDMRARQVDIAAQLRHQLPPGEPSSTGEPSTALFVVGLRDKHVAVADRPGRLGTLPGTALRCDKFFVTSESQREEFGLDHYYLLDVSVRLDQEIQDVPAGSAAKSSATKSSAKQPSSRREQTVLYYVRELPPGFPQGGDIHEEVRVPGFFLKLCPATTEAAAAESPATDARVADMRPTEMIPIFASPGLLWFPSEPEVRRSTPAMTIAITLFATALAAGIVFLWRWSRRRPRAVPPEAAAPNFDFLNPP